MGVEEMDTGKRSHFLMGRNLKIGAALHKSENRVGVRACGSCTGNGKKTVRQSDCKQVLADGVESMCVFWTLDSTVKCTRQFFFL